MKNIVVLGATGSVGLNTIEIIRNFKDKYNLLGISCGVNYKKAADIAREMHCKYVSIADSAKISQLKDALPVDCEILSGIDGMTYMSTHKDVDIVLCAVSGVSGFKPVFEAIKAKKTIALASKEILVMAGELVMQAAKLNNVNVLPVDSEHSAIFQCLQGHNNNEIKRIILTASGGPFLRTSQKNLMTSTYAQALNHPTWDMGDKITVDSATLMNKGLEFIEAKWLFDIEPENIDVVIHPESIIHSMVEFIDSTVLAQMSLPDMKLPIQYALSYPERFENNFPKIDFTKLNKLTFEMPDTKRFPALTMAKDAIQIGGTMPAVFNASNEVAVGYFMKEKIFLSKIWNVVEEVMSIHKVVLSPNISEILDADSHARELAKEILSQKIK